MRFWTLLSALAVCSVAAFGQTAAGTITGTVSDPAGAVVANAPLELKNSETGTVFQANSSSTGNYTFGQLPAATYQLTVSVPGFKVHVRQNLGVQAAQTIRVDVVLEVGTNTESVTVSAQASMLRHRKRGGTTPTSPTTAVNVRCRSSVSAPLPPARQVCAIR